VARTPNSAGNGFNAAFNYAAKVAAEASFRESQAAAGIASPGNIYTPEGVGEAYESNFIQNDPSSFMGSPDIFAGLQAPTNAPVGKRFWQQQAIMSGSSEYGVDEERLTEMGLGGKDYALRYAEVNPNAFQSQEGLAPSAGLTDIPTSTTNYSRPRTVAAGWAANGQDDPFNGTLTVVFRDTTVYNFYDVPRSVWIKFHNSISKGRGFLNHKNRQQANEGTLLQYAHGPADTTQLSPEMQEMVYAAARTKQLYYRNPSSGAGHYQVKYITKDATKVGKRDRVVGFTSTGQALIKKRVKTYGSPQGSYRGNTNPAENARIAKAAKGGTNPNKNAGKPRKK
jgi:hypothetical protein